MNILRSSPSDSVWESLSNERQEMLHNLRKQCPSTGGGQYMSPWSQQGCLLIGRVGFDTHVMEDPLTFHQGDTIFTS